MNAVPLDPAPRHARLAEALLPPQVRHELIAQAAYFRAQRRGFESGHELEDWLEAEAEVDTALTLGM